MNWADTQLYQHFLKKFSKLVEEFGTENMGQEVNELKDKNEIWYKFCVNNEQQTKKVQDKNLARVIWHNVKNNENKLCWMSTAREFLITKFIRERQIEKYPGYKI